MILSHRANPPTFMRYGQYKPYVREDFHYCCAYCVSHEAHVGELWAMTLDHFKPKKHFAKLAVTYSNLYYACCRCIYLQRRHMADARRSTQGKAFH